MRKIDSIIIHCTANSATSRITIDDIRRYHIQQGFCGIGYHYVIGLDGRIYEGRALKLIGAHCRGHNATSVGIAYIGGLEASRPADTLNPAQRESLLMLCRSLMVQYHIPKSAVYGHREFDPSKACPCFDVGTKIRPFL